MKAGMNSYHTPWLAAFFLSACTLHAGVSYSFQPVTGLSLASDTVPGHLYVWQANDDLGRYWADLSSAEGTGSRLARTDMPATDTKFYRVLDLAGGSFWYDWNYYAPSFLNAWNLGTAQTQYVHLDRPYEWYIDQAHTGTYSMENCGPTSVTMALKWVDGTYAKTVEEARSTYLPSGGWWYTSNIYDYLDLNNATRFYLNYATSADLKQVIDAGFLVILCIDTTYLTHIYTDSSRQGWMFQGGGGHFIVIKGYRVVDSTLYFEAYDPANADAMYSDGTPKGRNRHYDATSLESAILNWWHYMIAVAPEGFGGGFDGTSRLRMLAPSEVPDMPGM
jgi:hypothetical protein